MQILYITDQIYLHGGAEKILIQKLNYWVQRYGYKVQLITTHQNKKPAFFKLDDRVKWIDLEMNEETASLLNPKNISQLPKHCQRLKKEISEYNPDAIFLISLGFVRYILPFIAGKYSIYNEYHTSYYGFYLGYRKLPFLQKLKKQFLYKVIDIVEGLYTNVIFLNQAEFDHYNKRNAVIIPNFFDQTALQSPIQKKNQVISLGRLSYQKGYDLLIDAWEIVSKTIPDWTLEIYGNGENKEALQKQIAAKKLGHVIQLNPATDHVNDKLSESKFYVMSSRFETFPMVLLEAMSNGLPVIAFDCPTGPQSMMSANDSILVERENVKALAKEIIFLIQNDDLRTEMGRNASENVARFNPETVMAQWNQLVHLNAKKKLSK